MDGMDAGVREAGAARPRALALDIGNVLLDFDFDRVLRAVAPLGAATPPEILHYFRTTDLADAFERGRVEPPAFHRRVSADLGLQVDFASFRDLWNGIFTPRPGMFRLARRLARSLPVYAASNTNRLHLDHLLETYDVFASFRGVVASCDLGLRKPEKAFYEALAGRAGCDPAALLFVDDLAVNVEGARRAGLSALRFAGVRALEESLRALGLP